VIAVIFEVVPAPGRRQEYLDLAAGLRPALEKMDGFVSIERFESLTDKGKILSLSVWRDEDAVKRWRQFEGHRVAQAKGRGGIFADYRLRVASVIRDYGMVEREEAPADSRALHDARARPSKPGQPQSSPQFQEEHDPQAD
jgi:heme-degrading monooxygenase HmoA